MLRHWCVCLLVVCASVSSARAEEARLTLVRVIELARAHSPEPIAARARVDEARATLVGARQLATRNPVVDIDAGPRWSDGRSTDVQASLAIPFDLGRRDKRIAAANAAIKREQFGAQHTERMTVANAIVAYYQLLHAERRVALAEERVRLAEAGVTTAEQRAKAGDVAEFEVKLARGEVARAKSGVVAANSERIRARGQLVANLGARIGAVAGDLGDRKLFDNSANAVETRSDLRALQQEIDVARADADVARAERWPSLDLRVSYEHERGADIVLGGISIALPLFERGQGDAARARARGRRAQAELAARTVLATTAIDTAREWYAAAVATAQILEQDALPLAIENETAANASYRAGKIDLAALLVIRREALDTRREHLDRLLDAALAAVDLWIARGAPSLL